MLVSMLEILEKAKKGGYGMLAPNVFNEDSVRVCLEAAVELDSPIIIDVLPNNHKDLVSFGRIIRQMAEEVRVPVALNLDHGEYTNGEPDIDFERLEELKQKVDVPLVFHGGSFSGFDNIAKCCSIGCQKVNMGTDAYNYGLTLLFEDGRYQKGENIGGGAGRKNVLGPISFSDEDAAMFDEMVKDGLDGYFQPVPDDRKTPWADVKAKHYPNL